MTKLLAFTDPHFTKPGATIIGLDTAARFKTSLNAALHDHPDASALILLGDLAHHGEVDAYARLKDALADVPCPLIPMLGNHDRRETFLQAFPDAPQSPSGHIQTAIQHGPHHIITLDTLDGPPYSPGHHAGWLCDDRLDWLEARLAETMGAPTLICCHHPPFDTGIVGMDAIKLRNGADVLSRLKAHGNAMLVCGHIHRTISGVAQGVPYTMLKSTGHQAPLDFVTLDSALSIDEPPGYGVILLQPDGITIHHQDVLPRQQVRRDGHSESAPPA